MRPSSSSKLRGLAFALGALMAVAGVAAPAYAQGVGHDHDVYRNDHHGRGHGDWDRGRDVYVAPTYGYYGYGYPPPAVYYGYGYPPPAVYYPQPGLNITIPFDIR